MILGAKIVVRGHLAMSKAKLVEYEKHAFTEALLSWHKSMLPHHFDANAANVYKYERRTKKYMAQKQRKKGHQKPLVWSGSSQELAERRIDIRPTRRHTTGKVYVARAFNFSGRAGMPDMKAEVTRILQRERKQLARLIQDDISKNLASDTSVRTVIV